MTVTTTTATNVESRVDKLLAQMTLAEKIGQMTLVAKQSIQPEHITSMFIGGLLSGGGGYPPDNSAAGWRDMVKEFQERALATRLSIPMIYGVDAVHGHNNMRGATIFPHNIGLGATRDAGLVEKIARATAIEMAATGIFWDYAPALSVPQDIRWGRTYEGFGERTDLVTELSTAYLRGLQGGEKEFEQGTAVLGTLKHFVGDGGTRFDSSTTIIENVEYIIDQGVTDVDESTLRQMHLAPYLSAIKAGAQCVMASFSSWGGLKMHAHEYLLTQVLKGELGFSGFIVTDWQAIDQISSDYYQAVVTAVNAGIDMNMVPFDYVTFIETLTRAVNAGDVSMERIDDAVRRILRVKVNIGLFERPHANPELLDLVNSGEHRQLAREAAARSQVLLKNENNLLPLPKDTPVVFLAGSAADDIGLQCGGWTIEWQGASGNITPGTTTLQAFTEADSADSLIVYDANGEFADRVGDDGRLQRAGVGVVVFAEPPYAEGKGDRRSLVLPDEDKALIARVRQRVDKLVVVLLSGRPLIVTDEVELADAFIAAFWPGTEGGALADTIFGDLPFTGKLSYTWPRSMDQIPLGSGSGEPLFPFGYGLTTN